MNDLENVSLQPYYDSTNFKVGDLVTCMRLIDLKPHEKILYSAEQGKPDYRQVDFCGLVTAISPNKLWLTVEYRHPNGEAGAQRMIATFHRDELGMGYQPSWHPMVAAQGVQDWLSKR